MMYHFIKHNSVTGEIDCRQSTQQSDVAAWLEQQGWVVCDGDTSQYTHYKNGVLLTAPEKPTGFHEFDPVLFDWVVTPSGLIAAKEKAKQQITNRRDTAERSGFLAYGKTFDSDPVSIQRISLAVQAAQAVGTSFEIEWTCADNSTITLDYAQTLALPVIMAQAGNALHVKARNLKAQIDAATTLEEIQAVKW